MAFECFLGHFFNISKKCFPLNCKISTFSQVTPKWSQKDPNIIPNDPNIISKWSHKRLLSNPRGAPAPLEPHKLINYHYYYLLLFNRFAHSAGKGIVGQRVEWIGSGFAGLMQSSEWQVRSAIWERSPRMEEEREQRKERREKRE